MKSSKRSGQRYVILQTGGVSAALRDEYPDYPEMFLRLLAQAGMEPDQFSVIDARREALPDSVTADAYLITGSAHSVYEDAPWIPALAAFVEQVLLEGRPVVGVCFGQQLLAHYFGGQVARSKLGWRVGVQQHCTLLSRPAWLPASEATQDPQFSILASHQDQVLAMPAGAELLAAHPHCPIAAFTMNHAGGGRALAIQGHPEFDKAYLRALMLEREQLLGPAVLAAGLASLDAAEDGARIGTWIKQFLEQPVGGTAHG
ncbi:MAG: hypothetical protein AB8B93_04265 [Pseudomonadales bacterium]